MSNNRKSKGQILVCQLLGTELLRAGLLVQSLLLFNFNTFKLNQSYFAGRVARAGRTGNAFSLVNSEELAYVVDLYLFLGRSLNFVQPNKSYNGDRSGFVFLLILRKQSS